MNRSIILAAIVISGAILLNGYLERHPRVADRSHSLTTGHSLDQDNAIAAFPLADLSSSNESAALCEGIRQEVITELTKMGELKVVSSAEAMRSDAASPEVRAIGEKLGVSHVLVGSVQRAGNRVRVTLQLIEVATESHVWAEVYDRELTDLFAMESEIAATVAKQLATVRKA